jgi:hypothetical protein
LNTTLSSLIVLNIASEFAEPLTMLQIVLMLDENYC